MSSEDAQYVAGLAILIVGVLVVAGSGAAAVLKAIKDVLPSTGTAG